MAARLLTIDRGDGNGYNAIIDGLRHGPAYLYRREDDGHGVRVMAKYRLYGGAVCGIDFEYVEKVSFPQSPFERVEGIGLEGIGKNAGKPLKDIARIPIQVGDSLIVSSTDDTPRTVELGIPSGEMMCLSGKVKAIRRLRHQGDFGEALDSLL